MKVKLNASKNNSYKLSDLPQTQVQEQHRDRITNVYEGKISDSVTQARARNRIDWISAQIPEGRVFDIGCSEGILSVKLAEKGCHIDAIDIHPEVLEFARDFAKERIPDYSSLIDFQLCDIFKLEVIEPVYDAVVLGEVIEHVYEPANMLKRAAMAAKLQGLVIVTTPFGYAPAPDHHQTFLLRNFLEAMPSILRCEYLEIVDNYIRFIGRKICDPATDRIPEAMSFADGIDLNHILVITENATLKSQKFLRGVFEDRSNLLEKARAATTKLRDQRDANNSKIVELKKQLADLLAQKPKNTDGDIATLVRSDTKAIVSEAFDSLKAQLGETKTMFHEHENLLTQLRNELVEARKELSGAGSDAADKEREFQRLLAESREDFKTHLLASETKLKQLQDELALAQKEARDTNARAVEKEGELQRLLAENREDFKAHLLSSETTLKQLQDELALAQKEARDTNARAAEKEGELQSLLTESRADTRNALDALSAARDAHAQDRQSSATTARELEIRSAQIVQMKAELTKTRRKSVKLEAANIELRALQTDRDATLEVLRRELETAKAEMILLTRSQERLSQNESDLKLTIEAMQKTSVARETKLQKTTAALQDKLASTEQERNALSGKLSQLKSAFDDRVALLERARANSERLRQERDAANTLLQKKSSRIKRLGQRLATRAASNTRLRSGIRRHVPAGIKSSITGYLFGPPHPTAQVSEPVLPPPENALLETKSSQLPAPAVQAKSGKENANLVPKNATYDCALICHSYPGGRREYGGGFIKSRVSAYAKAGLKTLVVETNNRNQDNWFNHHEGVDCLRSTSNDLAEVLRKMQGRYKVLLMHSPTPDVVDVLPRKGGPAIAWMHGFEVRDYRRLYFNYSSTDREALRLKLDAVNATRFDSARRLFANPAIHKVFVSEFIKNVAQADVETEANPVHVIPNFIDTEHFGFEQKTAKSSKNVLLIRSFAARNYANDIATKAITLLSGRPGFEAFNFTLCGFGRDFEALTSPLRGLSNVTIREGVLNAEEMKNAHDKHGIFLAPSRFDTQGVTLGEAMSSGMACVTNRVCAIPEFCDEDSAVLVRPDDPRAFAEAIWALGHDPDGVARLSKAAAERARAQCAFDATIARELQLIRSLKGSK